MSSRTRAVKGLWALIILVLGSASARAQTTTELDATPETANTAPATTPPPAPPGQFAMRATDAAGNPLPGDLATGRQNLPEDLKNPVKLDENNVEVASGAAQVESVSWPISRDGQQQPPIDAPTTQAEPTFRDPGHYEVSNHASTRVPTGSLEEQEGEVAAEGDANTGAPAATGTTPPGGAREETESAGTATDDANAPTGTGTANTGTGTGSPGTGTGTGAEPEGAMETAGGTTTKEFSGQMDLEVWDYTSPEFDFSVTEGVWNVANHVWMTENPVDAHPGEKTMGLLARGPNFDPGVTAGEVPPVVEGEALMNPEQLQAALQAATPRPAPLYKKDTGEALGRIFDMDIADQVKNLVSKFDLTLDRSVDKIPGGHLFVAKDTRHEIRITRLADNTEEGNKPAPGTLDSDSAAVTVVTLNVEGSNPSEVEFERDADGLGGNFILRAENIDDPDTRWFRLTIEVQDRNGNTAKTVLPLVSYKRPLGVETLSSATQKKDGE